MAAPNKAQLLTDVQNLLKARYPVDPRAERLTILEAVIFAICHEGVTRDRANQALSRFKDDFFDWNEVRVSSIEEIMGVLADLPDAEARAQRIRRFLRQMFEKTYSFSLDGLAKKPQKDVHKALEEYDAFQTNFVEASVTLHALGGHAIPVDGSIRRGLVRLGAIEADADDASTRGFLERAVPKNRGPEFFELMEELTHDTCIAGEPDCPRCELLTICPTGQARASADGAEKAAPRKAKGPAVAKEAKPARRKPSAD